MPVLRTGKRTPTVVGIASPKGGVGKTTTAATLAALCAEQDWRVLLVDADENQSVAGLVDRYGDRLAVDLVTIEDDDEVSQLGRLHLAQGYDVVIVDLPGARVGGELRKLLTGADGKPAVDLLLMPSQLTALDLPPLIRAIRHEVEPAKVQHAVVLTRVGPLATSLDIVRERAHELHASEGVRVLTSVVREYGAHEDAQWDGVPITQYGGRHARARRAEADYRAVAREVFADLLHTRWSDHHSSAEQNGVTHGQ